MADITWSVKMPEELKERVGAKLKESGITGKEFMEALLNSYELQTVKEKRPEIAADLQELESLTKRLSSIYVNMGERISTILADKENYYLEAVKEKDGIIKKQEESINNLKLSEKELKEEISDLKRDKDMLAEEKIELEIKSQKEIIHLTEVNNAHKTVIEEYKEKNNNLRELVSEYEPYKKQGLKLKDELDREREKVKTLQLSLSNKEEALKFKEEKLNLAEEDFKKQVQSLKEQSAYEKDRALLDQEKSLRGEMQILRDECNGKVKELLDKVEVMQKERSFDR